MKKGHVLWSFVVWLCLLSANGLQAQSSDYYWSDNRKIYLEEDHTSLMIHFAKGVDAQALANKIAGQQDKVRQVQFFSFRNRAVVQLTQEQAAAKASEVLAVLGLEPQQVRSISYAQRLEDGFPLYLTHRIVLRMKRGLSWQALSSYIDGENVKYLDTQYGNILLEVEDIEQVLYLANVIRESGLVEFCHPDFYAEVSRTADPLYPEQFQMNNTGQTIDGYTGTPDIDIDGPEVWAITTGSSTITVAVIDDGVESHEDLDAPVNGYTPLNGGNGAPVAGSAHGQSCAGIIAANHNNIGVRGVAPQSTLLTVNIFAGSETATDIANGINWAVNNGADVLSNSWGYSSCTANFAVLTNALDNAANNGRGGKGCVVVFASGNDYASCVSYPANLSSVIAVGAVTNQGVRSAYSNYGPSLDLVAPSNGAAGVRTIDRMGNAGYNNTNYTSTFGGTSAACPVVSGVAALVLATDPNLTQSEVKNILYTTADDMGPAGKDNEYANGRVNAHQAVLSAQGGGGGGTPTYCTSQGNNATYEWISNVTLGSFSNNSGSAGYSDFTGLTANVNAGSSYSFSLTPAFSGQTYQEYFRVWIDFNQDGDFADAGEQVFAAGPTSTTASGTISIPATASTGNTRMRVSMKWNAAPTACETFSYGEVEDYTVNISAAQPTCDAPTGLTATGITSSSATLSWNAVTGASTYDLRIRPSGGSWTTTTGINGTSYNATGLAASTTYEFQLRTQCTNGVTSAWSATASFTTQAGGVNYCTSQGNNATYEWISNVTLGSFSNNSGSAGYSDFTGLTVNVNAGSSYSFSLTPAFSGQTYQEYFRVWIDFNQDGDFADAGEQVFAAGPTSTTASGTISIPATASTGNTRMRVSMKWNAAPTACETFSYGEVEDYTVNIGNAAPPAPTYCNSQGNNATYEWISNVTLGSFSNNSGSAGYSDFTGLTANVNAGSSYSFSLTPAFSGQTYQEYFRVWIDFNQDGDFADAGEQVFAAGPTSTTASGTISIPATALNGNTRMRVSMKWNAAPTACETFSYGEVEDYTVNISGGAANGNGAQTSFYPIERDLPKSRVDISPNPASEFIQIQVETPQPVLGIWISDASGQLRLEVAQDQLQHVKVADLPKGMYILFVKTEKEQIARRFVVQ